MNNSILYRLDWVSLFIYFLLIGFGLTNIYSTSFSEVSFSLFDWSYPAGKQFWVFCFSLTFFPVILYINSNFFEHLSFVFYIIAILSLLGLFLFGQKISGATSWYIIGGVSLQPAEFAKICTALYVATSLSSIQMDIKKRASLVKIIFIVVLPMILIILQPDAGSALVFMAVFFVLLREGLDLRALFISLGLIFIFIFSLLFDPVSLSIALLVLFFLAYRIILYSFPKTKRTPFVLTLGLAVIFSFSVDFIFNSVFEQRHRDRFNVILGLETDTRGIGYNINQSKIAIGSGGLDGKGF